MTSAQALPVARLLNVHQQTAISEKRGQFQTASYKSGLRRGSIIRTGATGRVLISFTNGTQVGLRGNSQLEIVSTASETKPLVIRLFGALSSAWFKPQGNTQVVTSAGVAAAPGTQFVVRLPREDQTEVTVTEGEVEFSNPQGKLDVLANQQAFAQVGQAPVLRVNVDVSGLTQWTTDFTGVPVEFEQALPPGLAGLPNGQQLLALFARGDYSAVREALANAQGFTPLVARSIAERYNRDAPAAQATAQAAFNIATDEAQRAQARLTLALAYLANNQIAEARAAFATTQETRVQDVPTLTLRGLILIREGQVAAAQEQLKAALQADPTFAQAHALLALTQLQAARNTAEVKEAELSARRAVQLAPNSTVAHSALGLALFFQSNEGGLGDQRTTRRRATAEAEIAFKLNPESPFSLLVYGRSLLAQQDLDGSLNAFQSARALAPDLPLLDSELGNVYLHYNNQFPRAERAFRRILNKNPDDAAALAGLGVALTNQGRSRQDEAETVFRRALQLEPNNPQARGGFALLLIEDGRFDEAENSLRNGLGTGPAAGSQYIALSEALLFKSRLTEANRYANLAVQALPASALSHYQLGRVLYEQESFAQAQEQFRQAAVYDPLFAKAFYALGQSLDQTQRGLDASRPLGDAISVNQSGPARATSLLNLQGAGAQELLQAILSDPTVIRTASRSLGDNQIDTRIGTNASRNYSLSHLQESDDRQAAVGLTYDRSTTDGVRSINNDFKADRIGGVIGRKAQDGSLGLVFQGQYERRARGNNEGVEAEFVPTRQRDRFLTGLVGFTAGQKASNRTRGLFVFNRPTLNIGNSTPGNSVIAQRVISSYHGEVRHDWQFTPESRLAVGGSFGQRRLASDIFISSTVEDFSFSSGINSLQKVNQFNVYTRLEQQFSSRFRATGELRVEHFSIDINRRSTSSFSADPTLSGDEQANTRLAPLFILEYRPDVRSAIRLRARQTLLDVQDFNLLGPRDEFIPSFDPAFIGDINGRGWGYDLEYDHSFKNQSFLRASVFSQRITNPFAGLAGGEKAASLKGAQVRYEGQLTPTTRFFTGLSYNRSTRDQETDNVINTFGYPDIPRYTAELGLNCRSLHGWFVQPSVAYIGNRLRNNNDPNQGVLATRLGGGAVFNIRLGKRKSVQSSLFLEVINATNKQYILQETLQVGRQIRVGAIRRF